MNTRKVHMRFWAALTERYGTRWADQYGKQPSQSWMELIDRFTPTDLRAALDTLPKECPDHPPTLPQFEAILMSAHAKASRNEGNHIRGFYRSLAVASIGRSLGKCEPDLEALIVANRDTLGSALCQLIDEYEDMERKNDLQRTPAMETGCALRAARIAELFKANQLLPRPAEPANQ